MTNKTLAAEMQELRTRLAEAEETARTAERQKHQLQRLLQEFRRRLTPLQLEVQRMVEKVSLLGEPAAGRGGWVRAAGTGPGPGLPCFRLHALVSYGIDQSAAGTLESPRRKCSVVLGSWPFL